MPKKPKDLEVKAELEDSQEGATVEETVAPVAASPIEAEPEPKILEPEPKRAKAAKLERVPNDLDTVQSYKSGSLAGNVGGLPPVDPEAINSVPTAKNDFDPSIHEVDKNGNPIPLKKGKGWRKIRGRKKINKPEDNSTPEEINEAEKLQLRENESRIKADCIILGHLNSRILSTIFDVEPSPKEKDEIASAYEPYIREKGGVNMPIWALPIIVSFGVVANHITEEKPKSRMEKLKKFAGKSFRNMYLSFKDWKQARKKAKE